MFSICRYVTEFEDHAMREQPFWLKSLLAAELVFQLPFFFVAVYGLLYNKRWLRIPAIIYGSHTATTLLPILAEISFSIRISYEKKIALFGCYLPYLFIPLSIVYYFSMNPNFGEDSARDVMKKQN